MILDFFFVNTIIASEGQLSPLSVSISGLFELLPVARVVPDSMSDNKASKHAVSLAHVHMYIQRATEYKCKCETTLLILSRKLIN